MRISDWSSDVCSSDLSGELIRFRCDGDGHGRQNGWAILYLDQRPAGAFGNYRLGISRKWRVDRDLSLTPAERQALQREWATAKQRRAEERARSEAEAAKDAAERSEEHTSELQSLMRISYAVFCLKKKTNKTQISKPK